jgi:preprotein translocase subunit SecG
MMSVLRIILTVIFVLVCIALTVIVLAQEGKSAGLGAIAGSNSFWEQNKSRSAEGKIVLATKILAVAFIVLALALDLSIF